jgi:hypothetical protein
VRTLSEAELDSVAGGRPDNVDQDNRQQMVSNTNRGDGTLGGTLYGGGYGVHLEGDYSSEGRGLVGHPVGG